MHRARLRMAEGLGALPETERALSREVGRAFFARLPRAGREQFARQGEDQVAALLRNLLRDALQTAADEQRPAGDRVAAIRMLDLAPFGEHRNLFRELLKFRQPQPVQAAAVVADGWATRCWHNWKR